jgi:hypothetical protein
VEKAEGRAKRKKATTETQRHREAKGEP